MASFWPTVPDFTEDPKTHFHPLKAVKDIVEIITRQRGGAPAPFARVFISPVDPQKTLPSEKSLQTGDLWIHTADSNKLKFWDSELKIWAETT